MAMTCIQNECKYSKYAIGARGRIYCVIGHCSTRKGEKRMVLRMI